MIIQGDGEEITEYGQLYSGGSMLVRPNDETTEHIYPADEWIEHHQRGGGKVFRRRIIVIEDWTEVPRCERPRP